MVSKPRYELCFDEAQVGTIFKSQRGMGLVEVMIAVAILAIVALGMSTLFSDMFNLQNKANTTTTVNTIRAQLIATINSGPAWEATINDAANTSMACLRTGAATPCGEGTWNRFNLKFDAATEAFYALTLDRGYSNSGQLCAGFSTSTPNGQCPFRWDLEWKGDCPGAATSCFSPDIEVRGTFTYSSPVSVVGGGYGNKSFNVRRGAEAVRNDAVIVSYVESDASGEGGGCDVSWVQRLFNRVVSDPGNNLNNKDSGNPTLLSPANQIQLKAGKYNCRILAPAFKNGGNRIRLRSTGGTTFTSIVSPVAVASLNGGSATPTIDATLVLNVDTSMVVEHSCTSNPNSADATKSADCTAGGSSCSNNVNWSLGVPTPSAGSYSEVTYTTVTCQRTS